MNGHITYATKFSTDVEQFQSIAENENLNKNDLRVFLFLCCRLNSKYYHKIDKSQMSDTLNIPKKKLEDSLDTLCDEGILEKGNDDHAKNGYKFIYTGAANF